MRPLRNSQQARPRSSAVYALEYRLRLPSARLSHDEAQNWRPGAPRVSFWV